MKSSKPFWLARLTAATLAFSVLAACDGDDGGPMSPGTGQIDPASRAATVEGVVNQFIAGNEALGSLNDLFPAIGTALTDVSPFAPVAIPQTGTIRGLATIQRMARNVESTIRELRARQASGARLTASIPVGVLGNTLVWNTNAQPPGYEVDPSRTGAPANGVRFIFYETAADALPVDPLVEIGHLDIIDTSSLPTIALSKEIVIGGVTLLFLEVTGTFTGTSFALSFSGFLSDGAGATFPYQFDVDNSSASFSSNLGEFSISLNFTGNPLTDTGLFLLTLSDASSGESLVFEVTADAAGNISGNISFTSGGGQTTVIAIISGTDDNPLVSNAEGTALTQAELQALASLIVGIGDFFEVFEELFDCTLFLILLGAV